MSLSAFTDVTNYLSVADNRAVVVAEGVDADVSPETAAILTDSPAFIFNSTLARNNFERLLRLARFPIFLPVKF